MRFLMDFLLLKWICSNNLIEPCCYSFLTLCEILFDVIPDELKRADETNLPSLAFCFSLRSPRSVLRFDGNSKCKTENFVRAGSLAVLTELKWFLASSRRM